MIDKAIANQSIAAKIFGCRWKATALHPFKLASGEVTQCGEDAGKGVLEARRTLFLQVFGGLTVDDGEDAIVRFGRLRQLADAIKIRPA